MGYVPGALALHHCLQILIALDLSATLFLVWPYLVWWAKTRATLRRLSCEGDGATTLRILEFQCTVEDAVKRTESLDEKDELMQTA